MDYQVELPAYQGPFDLLIDLIKKEEVSIWDIPISVITDQYIASLALMQELNLQIGAEFLVMAATLLQMKARSLIPRPQEEALEDEGVDPREELARCLLEYSIFKHVSGKLQELEKLAQERFSRPGGRLDLPMQFINPSGNATPEKLWQLANKALMACQEREQVKDLARTKLDLPACMEYILASLSSQGYLPFTKFITQGSRRDKIVAFLAILELTKGGRILLHQEKPYNLINISLRRDLSEVVGG